MGNFLPITQTEAVFAASGEHVVPHIILPVGVDAERIQINVPVARGLGSLIGTQQLHLITVEGERSSLFDAHNVTAGDGGVAYATGMHFSKSTDRQTQFAYDDEGHALEGRAKFLRSILEDSSIELSNKQMQQYKAPKLGLYASRLAITERLKREDRERGVMDEAGWAKHLNADFKHVAVSAAIERYCASKDAAGFFGQAWPLVWRGFLTSAVMYGGVEGKVVATQWAIIGATRRAMQMRPVIRKQVPISEYNPSLLNAYRLDRVVAAASYAASHRLIRVAK